MEKGTVIKIDKVKPFSPPEFKGEYSSKMLLDIFNSGSEKIQVNHGVLKAGCVTGGAVHAPPHDEVYIVLSGEAILHMGGVDYDIEEGTVAFIPGGTFHSLTNKSKIEDFVIITIWPGQPEPGANEVYDMRKKEWGKTYMEIEEDGK